MNRLSAITAFLGGVKNRYLQYQEDRGLDAKLALAAAAEGIEGVELCYPADFDDVSQTRRLLEQHGLGVSGVNVRSRRTGRWLRGAFSSAEERERREVVDDFRRAIDLAREVGTDRITTCPLNDGQDYVFEMNYLDALAWAAESFAAICEHDRGTRVCVEYKINDPRVRCLIGSAAEVVAFADQTGAPNLGATMDFGHALLAGERPAMSAALLHRAGRLFYVHVNDNDRQWDWDMLPGAYNLLELVEFFYYLREIGYDDDWYSYDVMSKEVETSEHFTTVARLTRRIERMADRIDRKRMRELMTVRNPSRTMEYLYETLFPEG
ncbi:MAG: sugar phosphate isomerase/epimerase family protein [bacterium]